MDMENHIKQLYGLDPDIPHPALGFPRLPPLAMARLGLPERATRLHVDHTARAHLDMFREMYRQKAAGLLEGQTVIPNGHPLYRGQHNIELLRVENEQLRQENRDLKARLEKSDSRL